MTPACAVIVKFANVKPFLHIQPFVIVSIKSTKRAYTGINISAFDEVFRGLYGAPTLNLFVISFFAHRQRTKKAGNLLACSVLQCNQ